MEQEWYDMVRAGWSALCDRCTENINRDEFFNQRNQRGVYCEKCWNWINIKRWECVKCQDTGSLRSERILPKIHCGEEVIWQK